MATQADPIAGRVLILAPVGRDAAACADVLRRAGMASLICADAASLIARLDEGADAALIAEEGLFGSNDTLLAAWVKRQAPWSDMPFVLVTSRQDRAEIVSWRHRLMVTLRNASLLPRPLHAATLASAVAASVRSRQRQYEARAYITERAQAAARLEDMVAERTAELQRQIAEREATEDALRQAQKMEAVGQLTGGIAHDFNNMLQGIYSGLELTERRMSAGRQAEASRYIDAMRQNLLRASALTNQLLSFSRRQALAPRRVDLNELISSFTSLIRQTAGPAIALDLDLISDGWPVRCDPNQLENALLNLAINARDAMLPEGGRLTIRTRHASLAAADLAAWDGARAGEFVQITVADTGTGMPSAVMTHVFEPFFTTKAAGQGTGLGLSQVFGFVSQSNGIVRLDSEVGRGTAVHLFLPRYPADQPAEAQALIPAKAALSVPVMPATILLVEDEADIRIMAAETLRDLGCHVIEATTGSDALMCLRSGTGSTQKVDMLITDIGLPGGLNGRQLADAARELIPDVPILLITGYAGAALGKDRDLAPGMRLLGKPFALAALADQVRGALSSSG